MYNGDDQITTQKSKGCLAIQQPRDRLHKPNSGCSSQRSNAYHPSILPYRTWKHYARDPISFPLHEGYKSAEACFPCLDHHAISIELAKFYVLEMATRHSQNDNRWNDAIPFVIEITACRGRTDRPRDNPRCFRKELSFTKEEKKADLEPSEFHLVAGWWTDQ